MFQSITEEISWLKGKLERNPDSMLYARLAERYLQMGEAETAENLCKNKLQYHDNVTAHLVLAKCYLKSNRFDIAGRELKNVLSMDPDCLMAHKLDSELKGKIGFVTDVQNSYEKILSIDPLDNEIQKLLAKSSQSNGKKYEPLMSISSEMEEPVNEPSSLRTDSVETRSEFLDVLDEETSTETEEEIEFASNLESDLIDLDGDDLTSNGISTQQDDDTTVDSVAEDISDFDLDDEDGFDSARINEELNAGIIDGSDIEDDFEETTVDELVNEKEQIKEPDDDFMTLERSKTSEKFATSAVNEDAILPDIEDDLEADVEKGDLDDEESRFSEILDDIFAPTMDEEERRENEARSTLERAADEDTVFTETEDVSEGILEELAIDPGIVQSVPKVKDEDRTEENLVLNEGPVFEEFNPFEDDTPSFKENSDIKDADFEPIELDAEPEGEDQFVDFLSSVNTDNTDNTDVEITEENENNNLATVEPELDEIPIIPPVENNIEEEPVSKVNDKSKNKFVTPTLGEIYAAQGQYAKAINVFEILVDKHPENEWYISKLEDLREKLSKQKEK